MAHQRSRYLLKILEKRLKLFPVVGILGARQTGKSTLIRSILAEKRNIEYVTLDREENRLRALNSPTLFIKNLGDSKNTVICIDEIQKAPVLFDTIKAEVDELRRPGRFIVTGSTEFSKKTGVRESLTGRIGLLRLFPLSVGETIEIESTLPIPDLCKGKERAASILREVHRWRELGGMPGICFIREEESRSVLVEAWIETTCSRDLANFAIARFNPDLARRILFSIAQCDPPIRTEIARRVGKLPRQIEPYIQAFKALHTIYEVEPYQTGTGKPLLYLFDAAVAKACGSDDKRRLQIWFLNECYSQFANSGRSSPEIFYYQTAKGSRVDFVLASRKVKGAFMLSEDETPSVYYLRTAEAFAKKHPEIPVIILNPGLKPFKLSPHIRIVPWTAAV